MALGTLSENERHCLDAEAKNHSDRLQDAEKTNEYKPNGLRVRFLDEEGKTERTVSADELDCAVSRVKKIHILKNRSSSETSILLRNPSLMKRRSSTERRLSVPHADTLNNNTASSENLNGRILLKADDDRADKTDEVDQTKDANGQSFKKNCNVYSVHQAKTLMAERRRSVPLALPRLARAPAPTSCLPAEGSLAEPGKDFTARTLGRLSRGLGKLLRRTNSVRISDPDPVYKVAYLGNVLTGWARGESCIEKPLATLWRNYQQSTKPDVVMKLSVTNSGLKGFTKEHGLTEYWSHRITYCASPPHYPKLFCWVYRHEGKKLKHELRCHAVLCTKESISKKITEELQVKLKQALVEFKKDRISKQNARLSLANSVYENPSMPRRKILLSVGSQNYRPPLERSKSAPKLGAIEELCSEEDEEEAEMKAKQDDERRTSFNENMTIDQFYASQTLDRRRPEMKSPRKMSCPEGVINRTLSESGSETVTVSDELLHLIAKESKKGNASHEEKKLEAIAEITEDGIIDGKLSQSNYLVTDSDDGSVSSGCETASTVTDTEPSSLPSIPQEDKPIESQDFERQSSPLNPDDNEVNHIPIGENNAFRRRSTYPPIVNDIISGYDNVFESLMDNLTDADSLNSSTDNEVFKCTGDNDSACSDESGYSELLDNKESVIGNTIMV